MLKIIELFAGVGSQTQALKNIGVEHEVVAISEIDKYAIDTYQQLHGQVNNLGDITKIERLPIADLWTYSFPCQDLSLAGKGAGIKEGTRSGLLLEVERLLDIANNNNELPKYLLLENVKNLVGKKNRPDFDRWLNKLEQLGYTNYWQVLNAKDYGVPQNRERVFVVSILDDTKFVFPETEVSDNKVINPLKNKSGYGWHFEQQVYDADGITRAIKSGEGSGNIPKVIVDFKFPEKQKLVKRLKDMLEDNVDEKYYLSEDIINKIKVSNFIQEKKRLQEKDVCDTLLARDYKDPKCIRIGGIFDDEQIHQAGSIYDKEGLSPTLSTMEGGWRQPSVIIKNATKQGYTEANEGDSVNLQFPNSKTRRGRVGHQVAQTIDTHCNQAVVEPKVMIKNATSNYSEYSKNKIINNIIDGDISKTITANCMQGVTHDNCALVVENNKNLKKQLCDYLIENGKVKENDVIRHSYSTSRMEHWEKRNIEKNNETPTLDTRCDCLGVVVNQPPLRIRKLTPRECWRLMGWKDEQFDKIQGISNSQLYKQAGNGIVVNVLEAIFMNLFKR